LNLEGSHLKDTLLKTRTEIFEESHINLPTSQKNIGHQRTVSGNVTYRERLGGHLHPRDMRRLVTPFSLSNEPELIVRRHAILLNCDPLRAIILRDKLMILVPDGADSLLDTIEKRVRGGAAGVENDIFGETSDGLHVFSNAKPSEENKPLLAPNDGPSDLHLPLDYGQETDKIKNVQLDDEEINELSARMNLPFELQCLDAVLHAVTELLANEADELEEKTLTTIEHLLKVESAEGKFAQEMLRASKNNVHAMISRVNGFNRAMTQILNEEEDLALCNLSRLISHPERFIQPVSPQILEEESDEPELILVSGIVAFAW
jgi:magnesium transporter